MKLVVNDIERVVDASPETALLAVLRDDLGLTGTRYGCGHGICGACYVLVGDEAVPACVKTVADVGSRKITTIEGLAKGAALHPVQQAFVDLDAMQCGYCTSGMIISAAGLLNRNRHPEEEDIRAAFAGHLCRCGVYLRAIRAVQEAAARTT